MIRILRDRILLITVFVTVLLSLVPLVQYPSSGSSFEGFVYGRYMDYYYTSVAREVYDGYPLLGNPFFYEHRESIAPAMILPFQIYALPLFAGFSLAATSIFNFSLWSVIFVAALYLILRRLTIPSIWAAVGSVFVYLIMYGQLIRVVSMEMVHPVFLLFILLFFYWWDKPGKYRDTILSLVIAFSIYIYPYLLHVIFWFLIIVFGQLLYVRDSERTRRALMVGLITTALCIPFLVITWIQVNNPYYVESLLRIGLGYTHIPSGEVVRGAMRIFPMIALALLSWVWIFRKKNLSSAPHLFHLLILGIAIWISSTENVITGLDLETASHVERFVMLWFSIMSVVALYFLYSARRDIAFMSSGKKITLGLLAALVFLLAIPYVKKIDPAIRDADANRLKAQKATAVLPALRWLDASAKGAVVWTNPETDLNAHVSVLTTQYTLFGTGHLHLMPTRDVEDRYLIAHSAGEVTLESITADVWDHSGVGAAIDTPNTLNRSVKLCRLLRLHYFGRECGNLTNARILYAENYAAMYNRFTNEIRPHLAEQLKKYHVDYVIRDTQTDNDFHPERMVKMELVYSDDRFEIYKTI